MFRRKKNSLNDFSESCQMIFVLKTLEKYLWRSLLLVKLQAFSFRLLSLRKRRLFYHTKWVWWCQKAWEYSRLSCATTLRLHWSILEYARNTIMWISSLTWTCASCGRCYRCVSQQNKRGVGWLDRRPLWRSWISRTGSKGTLWKGWFMGL